jgi:hypothetical protein
MKRSEMASMKRDVLVDQTADAIEDIVDMAGRGEDIKEEMIHHLILAGFIIAISEDPMEAYLGANSILDHSVDEFVKLNIDMIKRSEMASMKVK